MLAEEGIQKWREQVGEEEANRVSKFASERGTAMHNLIETYLKNEPIPPPAKNVIDRNVHTILKRIQHILNRIDNIRAQEIALWSDELLVAGTCDCVADYMGVPSIIDFKSSMKAKEEGWILGYFLQATAYAQMWKEHTGEEIDQIVIIMSSDDLSNQTFVKSASDYRGKLEETIIEYYQTKFKLDFDIQ